MALTSAGATQPLVSIVVPTFNGHQYLAKALKSCLSQSYRNIEVIVVDDCSSDGSCEIAEAIGATDNRLRVLRHPVNGGISRAFNTGFKAANGRYLTRLAQDDLFYPNAIELMVNALEGADGPDLVYCDMDQIDENDTILYQLITNPPEKALLPRDRLGLCVMWTRRLMDTVGWFDPKVDFAEDYDFWLRASLDFKFYKVPCPPQLAFRLHAGQTSITKARQHDATVIRVHIKYLWLYLKRSPLTPARWIKLLRSLARFVLFTLKYGPEVSFPQR